MSHDRKNDWGWRVSLIILGLSVVLIILDVLFALLDDLIPFGFLTIGGIILFIIGLIGFAVSGKGIGNTSISDEFSVDTLRNSIKMNKEEKDSKTKTFTEYLFLQVKDPPVGAVCMITKIALDKQENILQCPNCESYFQEDYLREWVKEKKICPVCKFVLEITVKKQKEKRLRRINPYL